MAWAWFLPAVALLSSPAQEGVPLEGCELHAQGVAFLGWGLWGFPAEKEPGNVVPKCEDTQASGALPLQLHPCFFPVMSPGLDTSRHFQELAPCPSAARPSASLSRDM